MKNIILLIALIVGLQIPLPIQAKATTTSERKLNLHSPYDTVCTHFMLADNPYKGADKALFMDMHNATSSSKSRSILKDLKNLLIFNQIDINTIPKNPHYTDPKNKKHSYILSHKLPHIYLVKYGEEWLYSKETIDYIKQYYISLKIRNICYHLLPKTVCEKKICMLAVWQYLLLISMAIIIWLTYKLVPYFFHYMLYKFTGNRATKYYMTERILLLFIFLLYLRVILAILPFQGIEFFLNRFFSVLTTIILTCLIYECINIIRERIKITKQHNPFVVYTLPFFSMVARAITVFVGFITMMGKLGFETTELTKVFSFGTLGVTFAAKDTIQNIFGSFLIMMDRPFIIGDEIIACSIRGKVEEIGLRATLLRTKEGSVLYIPNGKLADSEINNLSKRTSRTISLAIPVSYAVSVELLTKFIERLREIAQSQPLVNVEKTSIYIENMKENGLIISLYIHLDTTQSQLEQEYKHKIISLILQLTHQLNVRLE